MTEKLALGLTLRDKISGFTGIAASQIDFLTGNVQFVLQGEAKDGAIPEGVGIDAHQLFVVPCSGTVPTIPAPAHSIELGWKVKDIVMGVEGIAVRRATFVNGCVYYTVVTEKTAKNASEEYFIEGNRLDKTGCGVLAKITKKLALASEKPPGGPMTRPSARG